VPGFGPGVKSYEGASEATAKLRLFSELGHDAEIVDVIHQNSFFGLLGFGKVTVLGRAAMKEEKKDWQRSKARNLDTRKEEGRAFLENLQKASSSSLRRKPSHPLVYDAKADQDNLIKQCISAAREQVRRTESRNINLGESPYKVSSSGLARSKTTFKPTEGYADELKDIKTLLQTLSQEMSTLKNTVNKPAQAKKSGPDSVEVREDLALDAYGELTELLVEHEFNSELIEILIEALREEYKEKIEPSLVDLKKSVKRKLASNLKPKHKPPLVNGLDEKRKKPEIMVLVGPTGVGKTTTLSKIASMLTLATEPRSVAMITIDTFKVGAVEQIQFYADGLKATLEVVSKPEKIQPTIEKHSDKDIILIDTIGRGYKSAAEIASLKSFLPESIESEIHLVLSATAKYRDMVDTLRAYNHLGVDCLLFTKLDETSSFGPMLSVLQRSRSQMISYVTTGQRVPGDLKEADAEYLSNLMFQDHH